MFRYRGGVNGYYIGYGRWLRVLPPFRRRFQGKMRSEPISEGFPAMAKKPSEQITKASAEALTKSGQAPEKIMKGNAML
jgi:hypothetical protein